MKIKADVMLKLRDGRLHIFRRAGSPYFYYRWFENGRYQTRTSKTDNLALAKSLAENEYDSHRLPRFNKEGQRLHTWAEGTTQLLRMMELDEARISRYHDYKIKLGILKQFFSDIPLEQIKTKTIEDYIHWRKTEYSATRPNFHNRSTVSNKTLKRDFDVLRKVLRLALREEWITALPDFPTISVTPRALGWFTESEWKILRTTAKQWITEAATDDERQERQYLYDFMMFLVHVGCRIDEALCIRYQDCVVAKNDSRFSYILITGGKLSYIMKPSKMIGMYGATTAIARRKQASPTHKPSDLIFPHSPRELLVKLLKRTNLLYDDRGQRRSAKSFRHTFIMFRLLRGVDVYKLAQNCRTSVKQIQSHYGSYINAELSFDELTKMPSKGKRRMEEDE